MEVIQQNGITRHLTNSNNLSDPVMSFDQFKSNMADLLYHGIKHAYSRDYVTQTLLDMAVNHPEYAALLGIPEDFKNIKKNIVEPAFKILLSKIKIR